MSSVAKLLFQRMIAYGHLAAISYNGRLITYAELSAKALSIAGALNECGAERETIGIVGQRTPSSYFGILGILFAGCNYVPINPKYNHQKLVAMLRAANVRYLVGDKKSLELLEPVISSSGIPSMQAVILPEGASSVGKRWIDECVLQSTPPLGHPVPSELEGLAYILFTSGSTGVPKGVQVTNANLLAFLQSMEHIYDLDPGFRASQTFDFSFDPSVSDMFYTWANGGTLCVLLEDELMLPSEYLVREKITFWNSVPSIASFLYKMGHLSPGAFPELTHSMFCGEQFPKYLADIWRKAAPNSTIENLYGPTEATIYICRHKYDLTEENRNFRNSIIPIGRPFINHQIALIDENGQKVAPGGTGEIVYKGPQITIGYLNDPEKTANTFVSFDWDKTGGKWYRSGDLGFYNEDGNLECIGRKDSQIKLAGRRIEIGEIEAVLHRYPLTSNAVVVALRDANDVVTGCVAFITSMLSKEEEVHIRTDSVKYLDRIFFPKRLIYISDLPLTASGKVDRKKLESVANKLINTD
ncbi:MAG: amino acid adenylation domain-containing protein [Chlorobium sp.]|nr:MAG: D-alanine--poly(phosphoribitol) ligase [Chlorobium sp.]